MGKLNSLRVRLIAVIMLVVIAACGVVATFSMSAQKQLTYLALNREMRSEYQSVVAAIDYERKSLLALATLTAANPEVCTAFAARDRERLLANMKDGRDAVHSSFGYDILQFTIPPATNFLRVHNPKLFDDDVSARRKMIVLSNQDGLARSGIEPSLTSLAISAMAPVIHDGKRIGFAENGMNLGKPFVESIKSRFDIDVAFHLFDGKAFTTIISTIPNKTTASTAEYAAALAGTPIVRQAVVEGKSVAAYFG